MTAALDAFLRDPGKPGTEWEHLVHPDGRIETVGGPDDPYEDRVWDVVWMLRHNAERMPSGIRCGTFVFELRLNGHQVYLAASADASGIVISLPGEHIRSFAA